MFKKAVFKIYFSFAFLAAIIYCVPVYFFIREADYTQAWLLYVGNFLFMGVIVAFLFYFSRLKNDHPGTLSLDSTIGNFVTGAFMSLILPASLRRRTQRKGEDQN